MLIEHPPHTREEIVRLGTEMLRVIVEPRLGVGDVGRFVCIDVETGAYEVADDDLTAVDRLAARVPGAETYLGRVGGAATFRTGLR